jgi:hypothetical protein
MFFHKCLFILSSLCPKKKTLRKNNTSNALDSKLDSANDVSLESKESSSKRNYVRARERCYRCGDAEFMHIRVIDYNLLPEEYFHKPDLDALKKLEEIGISELDCYPDYWVHLPEQYRLTKYPYKVCDDCYNEIKDNPLHKWNVWITYI